MANDHLTLGITYHIADGKFDVSGDVKEEKQSDLIYDFLRTQMGAGEDNRKANEQDVYHIQLKWFLHMDRFEPSSDIGNYGLRDSILMDVASKLEDKIVFLKP